ncbi:MAG: hypothetical protein RH917_05245 [Lacipirellulaceae bacterium]
MSDHYEQPDDTLDALIHRALSDESSAPEPLQTERLTQFWQSLGESETNTSGRRLVPWMAAAVLLIATGGLVTYSVLSPGESSQPAEVAQDKPVEEDSRVANATPLHGAKEESKLPKPTPKPPTQPESVIAANRPAPPDSAASIGREPTDLERRMFMARTRVRLPKTKKTLHEAIEDSLEQLVTRPEIAAGHLLALQGFASETVEIELLDRLPLGTIEERSAILRLLAIHGSQASLDELIELTESDELRATALSTLEAIAGIESWPELTERITNGEARRMISQRLIAALDDDNPRTRSAATEAIGKSFDCTVTEALIERVVRQPSQNEETWFALFACRCPQANAFLLDASQNPKLLGQFNHARLQWALR